MVYEAARTEGSESPYLSGVGNGSCSRSRMMMMMIMRRRRRRRRMISQMMHTITINAPILFYSWGVGH